jgi:hypothetical protein
MLRLGRQRPERLVALSPPDDGGEILMAPASLEVDPFDALEGNAIADSTALAIHEEVARAAR